MKIGGLQPITASDFPGCMAAVVFTQGCNFRCPFCHNGSLLEIDQGKLTAVEEVLAFLHKRRNLLGGLVITGGEPCLQAGLADFCRQVKKMGFKIKLDTNGSRPQVLKELLEQELLDCIAMDIKAPLHRLPELTGGKGEADSIRCSINLIANSGIRHFFRTTDVSPLLDQDDHQAIRQLVPSGSPHITQPFVAENALAPALRQESGTCRDN
ncbi:MAG: anaerobic ribonucleoside-triphosphate reductase activating protein [Candidatus Electrothrix sp. ATG1]|nr:anaerobic ribonucleoside-triphosphate reductase activating protein [Candidatus Electrothrix sp. ATG1]